MILDRQNEVGGTIFSKWSHESFIDYAFIKEDEINKIVCTVNVCCQFVIDWEE